MLEESERMKNRFANFKKQFSNWMSFKNLANMLTKLNLSIEMYTNLIKEDEVFWRDPSLTYYESTKKTYLENMRVCLEEFNTIMIDIIAENDSGTTNQQIKDIIQDFSNE